MKLKKQSAIDFLCNSIQNYFNLKPYKNIIDFCLQDIDLSNDVSSAKDKIDLENYPYMLEPLKNCALEKNVRKEIVISWPDQCGKSLIQICTILFNCCYNSLQCVICYPSVDLANETALVKFVPLFKAIPQFKDDIEKPFAIRSDRFKLSNALIYWQGAGSKIVSKSCKLVLADEASIFETPNNVNNLLQLKKRTRSYDQCLQLFVSTPRYKQDPFWRQFLGGSQGYFYLRCQNCGQLTIRSCDIHNLQFETVYNEELKQYISVKGTERLICPKCHFQHNEKQHREKMVKQGAYIHTFPERVKDYPTFQIGVLASLLNTHVWGTLANIQLSSGKSSTLEDAQNWDNSYRGLPYQQREYNKQDQQALKAHYYKKEDLKKEDIEAIYIVSDVQDTFYPCGVFAYDKNGNLWCLELFRLRYAFLTDEERNVIDAENKRDNKSPETTLLDLLDRQYLGIKPLCLLIDYRGHRSEHTRKFSQLRRNIICYGGTSLKYDKFKPSQNIPKLFLCDAKKYQAQLIFMLYFQKNKDRNYIYLPENISEKDVEEITSFQPDKEHRNGNLYQNWIPGKHGQSCHDFFDVCKMALCAVQISAKIFHRDKFRLGKAPVFQKSLIPQKKKTHLPLKKSIERRGIFKNSY